MRRLVFGSNRGSPPQTVEAAVEEQPSSQPVAYEVVEAQPAATIVPSTGPVVPIAQPQTAVVMPRASRIPSGAGSNADSLRSEARLRLQMNRPALRNLSGAARNESGTVSGDEESRVASELANGALFAARFSLKCLMVGGRIGADEARSLFAEYESKVSSERAVGDVLDKAAKNKDEWSAFTAIVARMIGVGSRPLSFITSPPKGNPRLITDHPGIARVLSYYSCPIVFASPTGNLVTLGCRNPAFWVEAAGSCAVLLEDATGQRPYITPAILPSPLCMAACEAQFGGANTL